jgi:hypothetical protein
MSLVLLKIHELPKDTRLAFDCVQLIANLGGSISKTKEHLNKANEDLSTLMQQQKVVDDVLLDAYVWNVDRLNFIDKYCYEYKTTAT